MGNQGFASQTQQRRKILGSKGGKMAHQRGTRFAWKPADARAMGSRGVAGRKAYAAKRAAKFLLDRGFKPTELFKLSLSADEYIYYGGSKRTAKRLAELKERVNVALEKE